MKSKIHIVNDKNLSSIKIKKNLIKKVKTYSLKKSDIIIVIGGDGFMLNSLKRFHKYNKPFYGINSGNYGFLMNKFSHKSTIKNLSKVKSIRISPVEMIVKNKFNVTKKSIAINEVSILRQSRQAASLSIYKGRSIIIKKLVSDGVFL